MREPSLLKSYPGPDPSGDTFDAYLYLRPETNGVVTESTLMKVVVSNERWHQGMKLVYLANYPGDFIQTRHLVEHHYRVKIAFARSGGRAFTPGMRETFENRFEEEFPEDRVMGAFDALDYWGIGEEELFDFRVPPEDMLVALGQNVKRRGDRWIVNYDIPAILHRNTFETDIAVMVFRVSLEWDEFRDVILAMGQALVDAGVMAPMVPPSRVFHYSRSPFEQILDGIDFLWGVDISDGGAEDDISFGAYLMEKGVNRETIQEAVGRPLVEWRGDDRKIREGNLLEMTAGKRYDEAYDIWRRVTGLLSIPVF